MLKEAINDLISLATTLDDLEHVYKAYIFPNKKRLLNYNHIWFFSGAALVLIALQIYSVVVSGLSYSSAASILFTLLLLCLISWLIFRFYRKGIAYSEELSDRFWNKQMFLDYEVTPTDRSDADTLADLSHFGMFSTGMGCTEARLTWYAKGTATLPTRKLDFYVYQFDYRFHDSRYITQGIVLKNQRNQAMRNTSYGINCAFSRYDLHMTFADPELDSCVLCTTNSPAHVSQMPVSLRDSLIEASRTQLQGIILEINDEGHVGVQSCDYILARPSNSLLHSDRHEVITELHTPNGQSIRQCLELANAALSKSGMISVIK